MVRIHSLPSFVRLSLLRRSQSGNMVHIVAEQLLAVVPILSRIENVLMPELVNFF